MKMEPNFTRMVFIWMLVIIFKVVETTTICVSRVNTGEVFQKIQTKTRTIFFHVYMIKIRAMSRITVLNWVKICITANLNRNAMHQNYVHFHHRSWKRVATTGPRRKMITSRWAQMMLVMAPFHLSSLIRVIKRHPTMRLELASTQQTEITSLPIVRMPPPRSKLPQRPSTGEGLNRRESAST